MKQKLNCPLCSKLVYSGLGNGCKMCGMPLETRQQKFCSDNCKIKYQQIQKEMKGGSKI